MMRLGIALVCRSTEIRRCTTCRFRLRSWCRFTSRRIQAYSFLVLGQFVRVVTATLRLTGTSPCCGKAGQMLLTVLAGQVPIPPAPSGGLVYWPDRVVSGGACDPSGSDEVEVVFHNATDVGGQRLVVYATGGRSLGLESVQVERVGEPAGGAGLRRVEFTLG